MGYININLAVSSPPFLNNIGKSLTFSFTKFTKTITLCQELLESTKAFTKKDYCWYRNKKGKFNQGRGKYFNSCSWVEA